MRWSNIGPIATGVTRCGSWYFEVWNEPNLKDAFWSGGSG